jgi:hypothetical protein
MVVAVDTVLILMIIVNTFLLAQCHMEEDSVDHSVALVDHSVASVDQSVALVEDMVVLVDHTVALVEDMVDQMLVLEDHMVGKASATHSYAESTYIIIFCLYQTLYQ